MENKVVKTWVDEKGKAWETVECTCPRCGGVGLIPKMILNGAIVPVDPDGGVCYKCWGAKVIHIDRRVLTDKEKSQRERAKVRQQEKRAEEEKQRQLQWEAEREQRIADAKARAGFNSNDESYIVLGDSFSIKDQIKADGGRFIGAISKWVFLENKEGYKLQMVKFEDVARIEDDHEVVFNREAVKAVLDAAEGIKNLNQYVGVVGDRYHNLVVTIKNKFWYDTQWGSNCIIIMTDEEGHEFKWNSSCGMEAQKGETVTIKGTIKAHEEYNGVKQTVLTRCKEVK